MKLDSLSVSGEHSEHLVSLMTTFRSTSLLRSPFQVKGDESLTKTDDISWNIGMKEVILFPLVVGRRRVRRRVFGWTWL